MTDQNQYIGFPTQNEDDDSDFLSDFDFGKLKSIIFKNIIWLILIPALCAVIAFFALRYIKPLYQSSSSLKMKSKAPTSLLLTKNTEPQNNLIGELEILKSPLIYDAVIDVMRLDITYFDQGRVLDFEAYKSSPFEVVSYSIKQPSIYNAIIFIEDKGKNYILKYEIGGDTFEKKYPYNTYVSTPHLALKIKKQSAFTGSHYFILQNRPTLYRHLTKNVEATILNMDAGLMGVAYKDYNRHKAQDMVKTIDSVYTIKSVEIKNRQNLKKLAYLEGEIAKTEAQLLEAERALENFILENGTNDIESKMGGFLDKVQKMIEERTKMQMAFKDLMEVEAIIRQNKSIDNLTLVLPENIPEELTGYLTKLNELKSFKEQLSLSEYNTTVQMQRINVELNLLNRNLIKILADYKADMKENLATLEVELQKMEDEFASLPRKASELNKIKKKYGFIENYYFELTKQKIGLGLAEAGVVPDFEIIASANLPAAPISPRKLMIYGIAVAIGIILSLGLMLLQYFMHNTITNQKDIERLTTLPILGVVPKYSKAKMEFSKLVVHHNPKSSISESFRSLRTNLDFMFSPKSSDVRSQRVVSVTSSISGEGKTFIATNLAGIVALSNLKVIVIDIDMRKPKLHIAMGASNVKGVSTILIGKHSINECVHHSDVKNLDFVTAGPVPPNPSELILRAEFSDMLYELKKEYDVVVLDTPPIGLVTDGMLIMKHCTARIFVMRANYSKKFFAKNIKKLISNHNIDSVGIILNAVEGRHGYGYGYGGYGYGYYEDDAQKEKWWNRLLNKLKG